MIDKIPDLDFYVGVLISNGRLNNIKPFTSKNSLSRALDMSHTYLYKIIMGERPLTPKLANKFLDLAEVLACYCDIEFSDVSGKKRFYDVIISLEIIAGIRKKDDSGPPNTLFLPYESI